MKEMSIKLEKIEGAVYQMYYHLPPLTAFSLITTGKKKKQHLTLIYSHMLTLTERTVWCGLIASSPNFNQFLNSLCIKIKSPKIIVQRMPIIFILILGIITHSLLIYDVT